jgi:beta-phosphoglucomutase-like phosphatase (HAD superfamily)
LSDCAALPGAQRLIQHLHQCKIPLAICTNSTQLHFEIKTKKFPQWLEMIPLHVIAASDPEVKRPKPFPDPFIVTMKRFEEKPKSPRNVLIFEGKSLEVDVLILV